MKKLLAAMTAAMLMFSLSVGTAFAAESPNAESPNAESPNADSPNADSPNADSPNADSPNADSPNAESTGNGGVSAQSTGSSSQASAVSPKTGIDLTTTAGITATLLFGAVGATVLLRRELSK